MERNFSMKKKLNDIFSEFSKLVDEVFSEEKTEVKPETIKTETIVEKAKDWVLLGDAIVPVVGTFFKLVPNSTGSWGVTARSLSQPDQDLHGAVHFLGTKDAARAYLRDLVERLNK